MGQDGYRGPLSTTQCGLRGQGGYLTISLSDLRGKALTTVRAGLALIIISSPVAGLRPMRGGEALRITFLILSAMPGTVTMPVPFLPNSRLTSEPSASKTSLTCFLDKVVSVASS